MNIPTHGYTKLSQIPLHEYLDHCTRSQVIAVRVLAECAVEDSVLGRLTVPGAVRLPATPRAPRGPAGHIEGDQQQREAHLVRVRVRVGVRVRIGVRVRVGLRVRVRVSSYLPGVVAEEKHEVGPRAAHAPRGE